MSKEKFPSTSIEAYKKATNEMLQAHHAKIISALEVLGSSTFEEIAAYLTFDKHQVGRRMKELEGLEKVYKPGEKRPTKSGRNAFLYCLTAGAKTENLYKKDVKTAADFASQIIASTKTGKLKQKGLFDED